MPLVSRFKGIYDPERDSIGPFTVCNPSEPEEEKIPNEAKDLLPVSSGAFRWIDGTCKDLPPEAHAIIARSSARTSAEIVKRLTQLRIVNRSGVGTNNQLPNTVNEGVLYQNCCPYSPEGVSELIMLYFGMYMSQIRQTDRAFEQGKPGNPPGSPGDPFPKKYLRDPRTLQVVLFGHGAIGSALLPKLQARHPGLRIAVHDPDPAVHIPSKFERVVDANDAKRRANVLIFCVPGQAGCLLGPGDEDAIQNGCFIINTSRGNTVDAKTLLHLANVKNVLFGLDVHADEDNNFFNRPENIELVRHPGKIAMTQHIGGSATPTELGNAQESVRRIAAFAETGMVNRDDRRELPLKSFIPSPVTNDRASSRLFLVHGKTDRDAVNNMIAVHATGIGLAVRNILTEKGRELADDVLPFGVSVADVLSSDPKDAERLCKALKIPLSIRRRMISVHETIASSFVPDTEGYSGA